MKSQTFFLNLLYDRGNVYSNVIGFFSCARENEYKKLLGLARRKSKLNEIINIPIYCATSKDFKYLFFLENLSISKLMTWFSLQLSLHKDEITIFSNIKNKFENYILSKQYDLAKNELEDAKEKFGVSLWLIESYSVLIELDNSYQDLIETLDERLRSYYDFIKIKNNLNDDDVLYRKRINGVIANADAPNSLKDYYLYKLCVETPQNDLSWKNILVEVSSYSLIDIYLVFIECLQRYNLDEKKDELITSCLEVLCELDVPVLKMINSLRLDDSTLRSSNELFEQFMKAVDSNDYNKIVSIFYSNEYTLYECFSAFRFVAIAYMYSNKIPDNSNSLLTNRIVRLIYNILADKDVKNSANELMAIARLLNAFQIHKGICVFIQLTTKMRVGYRFLLHINTVEDEMLFEYECKSNNIALIPYKSLYSDINLNYLSYFTENREIIQNSNSYYYQKNCYDRVCISKYIHDNDILAATQLLIESLIDKSSLIFTINHQVLEIVKSAIEKKLKNNSTLEIQEICWLFRMSIYKESHTIYFLSFLEDNNCEEPLDIIYKGLSNKLVNYFLVEICQKNILASIYWLFSSAEEVDLYRIKICDYIVNNTDYENKRIVKKEMEDLTKNLELKKSLINVDNSRISINFNEIYLRTVDDLNYQLGIYNSSENKTITINKNESVRIFINNKFLIIDAIYKIYAKEFCFCNCGLDESLSTRVRHGTLSNQLLRTFIDNDLTCDGHGKNAYFDELIKLGFVDEAIHKKLLDFSGKINERLNQLVRITLKVFLDTPIDGAIFNYNLNLEECTELYGCFLNNECITAEDAVSILNDILIRKTNRYLDTIKNIILPKLLQELLNDIDTFLSAITPIVLDTNALKDIEKKLTDCKISLQAETNTVSKWFNLSEYENWKDFTFYDLIDMCTEIDKKLFSGFDRVKIVKEQDASLLYKGSAYRQCIDIALMLFNNAICHSGYENNLDLLEIQCSIKTDSKSVYFIIQNNLSESIDINALQETITKINDDYRNDKYLEINTRQEGGMGLYKIMSLLYSAMPDQELFCVSTNDNMFRVELKMSKEIICSDENFNC